MADRDRVEQLDLAIAAALSGAGELRELVETLREMPRAYFRARLLSDLDTAARLAKKEEKMQATTSWIREGLHTVNPYLIVNDAAELMRFIGQTFGASQREVHRRPDGSVMHAEMQVGESVIELSDGSGQYAPMRMALHVYVQDVDAVYRRAVEAGGTSLYAPMDQPYGDRDAGVKDPLGNHWYIGTHQGAAYIPAGLRDVTPYLHLKGAEAMIAFLQHAFGVGEPEVHRNPQGGILHAKARIGDSVIEFSEAHENWQPMPANLHLYVEDADAWYRRAVEAGAKSRIEPADQPYGDRMGGVEDAWGNLWWFATHLGTR
jgi:uncharacterized glyoxalase superfamily protein PhnB